jgi:hypothetical protein
LLTGYYLSSATEGTRTAAPSVAAEATAEVATEATEATEATAG